MNFDSCAVVKAYESASSKSKGMIHWNLTGTRFWRQVQSIVKSLELTVHISWLHKVP